MPRSISNPQLTLRPQDLLVLLRLALPSKASFSYASIALELGLTASETHAVVERAIAAQLAFKNVKNKPVVIQEALKLFVVHGARYCFPAMRGEMTRGVPTGHSAAPIKDLVIAAPNEPALVWPHKKGTVRGMALFPLYPSVPEAALRNPALYEVLVLFDAIRAGSPRERALAIPLLEERLKQ